MLKYMVILGAAAQLFGIFFYIKATLKGETKPNKVTWLMWTIAPFIGTVAALSDGVRWAVLPVFIAWFSPLLVFIASFVNRKSYRKLEKFDYICGACSILALALRGITKEPMVAIWFAIASDWFAAVPTIIKWWKHPQTESAGPYAGWIFSSLTSFFAMKTFGLSEIAFPIYFIVTNSILIFAITRGKLRKKRELK